jgi:hypothetical protein
MYFQSAVVCGLHATPHEHRSSHSEAPVLIVKILNVTEEVLLVDVELLDWIGITERLQDRLKHSLYQLKRDTFPTQLQRTWMLIDELNRVIVWQTVSGFVQSDEFFKLIRFQEKHRGSRTLDERMSCLSSTAQMYVHHP